MEFASKAWRVLVAIKDGLALLFLLLFFLVLFGALSARPSASKVRDGALLLRLNGAVVEEPAEVDPLDMLLATQAPIGQYRTRDIVRALKGAAKDDKIKAVVLDLSRFSGGGMVSLQDVGAAMDEVRAAKKPVLTFATAYVDDGLLLAAHASEVWVDPIGGVYVMGPGGKQPYLKGLLDRFKVTANIYKVGTFKDAIEPFSERAMSAPSREARTALYGALFDAWKADVAKARPQANLALVTSDPVGWYKAAKGDGSAAAKAAGLVDKIGTPVDFGKRVAALAGEDSLSKLPGAYAHTKLNSWLAANPVAENGKAIGVITVAGEIVDGKAGPGTAGGDRIAQLLDEALEDDLAALVVRVDSPGGSVMASEAIRTAIERHKANGIPIAVSMGNLAASGGYWVSTPAQRIFAEPATITGSIGIFALVPSFERALGEYGVTFDGVKTTPLSGEPDLFGGIGAETSAMIQSNIEHGYNRFLGIVSASRKKTPEEIDRIAQGRVWDGGTARQLGLVDEFGGLEEALAWAAKAAKLDAGGWHAKYIGGDVVPYASLLDRLGGGDDEGSATATGYDLVGLAAERQRSLLSNTVTSIERLIGSKGVQAYCLECPVAEAPQGAITTPPSLWVQLGKLTGLF